MERERACAEIRHFTSDNDQLVKSARHTQLFDTTSDEQQEIARRLLMSTSALCPSASRTTQRRSYNIVRGAAPIIFYSHNSVCRRENARGGGGERAVFPE